MKVLLADQHTLFRENLSNRLQRFSYVTELQEVAGQNALNALAAGSKTFDLVFVDKELLGTGWREGLKRLIRSFPAARVIFMGESEAPEDILDAFETGVKGYLTKLSSDSLIMNALRMIMDGNVYVPAAVLKGMVKSDGRQFSTKSRILSHTLPNGKSLTVRQSEVLLHLSDGLSNKQIAYEMSVSEATVKLHINALLRNLRVENRTKAVVTAQRMGILEA